MIEYLVIDSKGEVASTHLTETSRDTWLFFVDLFNQKGYTKRDQDVTRPR